MPVALQIILSAVLSLPFTLMDAWTAAADARLDARLKAIRDAGDPVTMAELARLYPEPPKGQNAADFYKAAFQKMDELAELPANQQALLPIVGTAELPDPDLGLPPAMLAAIHDYLKANAEALDLLRKAAALDACKFELDFTKGPGMLLPHLAKLRQGARLLALEAIERTESAKPDDAAQSLVADLRIGQAVAAEPILISSLVRIACDAIAVGQVERWASRAKPSDQALQRLQAQLAANAAPRVIERAMVGERCFGIDIYQNYVLQPKGPELMGALGMGDGPPAILLRAIPSAYFKSDMIWYLDIMNRYVDAARKPYPENFQLGDRLRVDIDQAIPKYYVVSRMILPALSRVFTTGQTHVARCETARVGLAVLRRRVKHGQLPKDLNALVPAYLDRVPLDPFDGKPLRYRKDADGFVVYTLGENGKDDAGDTERREGKQPDVGFRVRWPKAMF